MSRSVHQTKSRRGWLGAVIVGAAGVLAAGTREAESLDYALHMAVRVAPQCAQTRTTNRITLYSVPGRSDSYVLRRGLGRLLVVCNTAYAMNVRHYDRRTPRAIRTSGADRLGVSVFAGKELLSAYCGSEEVSVRDQACAAMLARARLVSDVEAMVHVTSKTTKKLSDAGGFLRTRWSKTEKPEVLEVVVTSRF